MNTINFIVVVSMVLLATNLIYPQVVDGQNQSSIDVGKYLNEDEVQMIILYCFQHADRPNPVQDLIDKGFISTEFAGDTCISVKQGNEEAQKIRDEVNSASLAYAKCAENQSTTYADCQKIIQKYCDEPLYFENFGLC